MSTVAGSGQAGSRDGTLADASFGYPYGICVDKSMGLAKSGGARLVSCGPVLTSTCSFMPLPVADWGCCNRALVVSDFEGHAIRRVDLETGTVCTLAGGLNQRGCEDGPCEVLDPQTLNRVSLG